MTDKLSYKKYPATLTVVQAGTTLSGRWSGTSVDGPDTPDTGVMTGTYAADGSITMKWESENYYNCPHAVNGTVSDGVMTAQYGTECSSNFAIGSLTLTRQGAQ